MLVNIKGKIYEVTDDLQVKKRKGKGFIKPFKDKDGYLRYAFTTDFGTYNVSVHRFNWEIIYGDIPDGMTIDHIDGNKENNEISNLQLLTRSDNVIKGNAKHWKVISPSGDEYIVYNLEKFCRENNLHSSHMRESAKDKGRVNQYKGWKCYVY